MLNFSGLRKKSEAPNVDILCSESFKSVQNAIVDFFFVTHYRRPNFESPLVHGCYTGTIFSQKGLQGSQPSLPPKNVRKISANRVL